MKFTKTDFVYGMSAGLLIVVHNALGLPTKLVAGLMLLLLVGYIAYGILFDSEDKEPTEKK